MAFSSLVLAVSQLLLGQWQFYKMIYQGQEMPPRDSNLVLQYTFEESGVSRLKWSYKNDSKFHCERIGQFSFDESNFYDKVTWVNPDNSVQCGSDPDMQLGRISQVPYSIVEGDLFTKIPLNGEVIYYVWKRIE